MKKMMYLILLYSSVYANAVIQGPVELKDETYQKLTVHGNATLHNVTVDNLVVNGTLTADTVVAKKVSVHGPVYGKALTAKILEATGAVQLIQSNIEQVSASGSVSIRGLKTKNLFLFAVPQAPLYAVRAENIIIKAAAPIELKVGDACYIDTIRFVDAAGEVYVMKDRSYVGDIINGSLHR